MNPIADICWSCMFPLTIGSTPIMSDGEPDIDNPSSPVCFCSNPPRIGVAIEAAPWDEYLWAFGPGTIDYTCRVGAATGKVRVVASR